MHGQPSYSNSTVLLRPEDSGQRMLREAETVILTWWRFCSPGNVGNVWRLFGVSFLVDWGRSGDVLQASSG